MADDTMTNTPNSTSRFAFLITQLDRMESAIETLTAIVLQLAGDVDEMDRRDRPYGDGTRRTRRKR